MDTISSLVPQLDLFVHTLSQHLPIPGMAISLVSPHGIVWQSHNGSSDHGYQHAVHVDTVFAIASNTKAMTSMALGVAHRDGLCDINAPLRQWVSQRLFGDEVTHQHATMRDLAGHVTGLPRHELVLFDAVDRTDVVRRLPYLAASAPFRSRMQYQNLLYVVLGHLLEQLYALPYEDIVQRHVAEPFGLDIMWRGRVTTPAHAHGFQCDMTSAVAVPAYTRTIDNPAGGVMMSNRTLARWLQVLLQRGAPVIPRAIWQHLVTPVLGGDVGYAMGWDVQRDRGVPTIQHGGVIDGFQSGITLWPDHGIALGVMTNQVGIPVPEMLRTIVHDHLCQQVRPDYLAYFAERYTATTAPAEPVAAALDRVPEALCGRFIQPGYGLLTVHPDAVTYAGQSYALVGTHVDGWWATYEWGIRLHLVPIGDGWRLESHAGSVSVAEFVRDRN
jgi:CubicO group peptidase (beta-lactamase class C family)